MKSKLRVLVLNYETFIDTALGRNGVSKILNQQVIHLLVQRIGQEHLEQPVLATSETAVLNSNKTAKNPIIYGIPLSGIRFLVGALLRLGRGGDFQLFYDRWLRCFFGTVQCPLQVKLIKEFSLSVDCDEFVNHESFASDRLSILHLAGGIHASISHPRVSHHGGDDFALVEAKELLKKHCWFGELSGLDLLKFSNIASEAHRWFRNPLGHRESARFMFSHITGIIPKNRWQLGLDL